MNTTTVSRERDHHRGESVDSSASATAAAFNSLQASAAAAAAAAAGTSSGNASNTGGGGGATVTTMTGSIGSGSGVVGVTPFRGFRSQSPSHRRSRERNRTHARTHGSDQGGLLAYGAMGGGSGGGGVGIPLGGVGLVGDLDIGLSSAGVTGGVIDDTRLSGNQQLLLFQMDKMLKISLSLCFSRLFR